MLKLFAGLGFAMFLLSPGQEKNSWSELGGSSLRKNASSEKVQDKLRLIWKVRMGCPVAGHAQFTTGAGLIFGSSPWPRSGDIYAFDPGTGKVAWEMHHKYGLSTTPAYKDGIVFATFGNELYAFDADIRDKKDEGIRDEPQGRDRHDILWKAELKGSICRSSPLFYREMVLLNTVAGVEFYPVRPKKGSGTGRIKIYETGGTLSAGMAHNGSILVAASRSGHVAYDLETDRKLWTAGAGLGSSPCIDGGFVYFADAAGRLQCVRIADGKPAWKSESRFQVGTYASPSTDKGIVYATGGQDGTLHAVDGRTGKTVWTFEVPLEDERKMKQAGFGRAIFCKPLICDGKVYFTSYSGYLYCVREGKLLWKERISESICMTIPMAYKGAIYVRGKGATYKFGSRR